MADGTEIFRKESLERLSSPERLDELIYVTDPKGWLALIAVLILLGVAIIWSIFGSIPTKVNGTAILVRSGGVSSITPMVSGRIDDLSIQEGDLVEQGDVVARIEQPELLNRMYLLQKRIDNYQAKMAVTTEDRKIAQENLEARLRFYEDKKRAREALAKEGLLTKESVVQVEDELLQRQNAIKQLKLDSLNETQSLDELRNELATLKRENELYNKVISNYSGRILEIKAHQGDLINVGSGIATLERLDETAGDLTVIAYVPAKDGKKIQPGMTIQLTPSIIEKEQYGSMLGKVTYVSPYPTTSGAIQSTLKNEDLVRTITAPGPVVEVKAYLERDNSTFSKYKWTTTSGAPIKIFSGIIGDVQLIVAKQRPITLVIPLIKKTLYGKSTFSQEEMKGK